MKWFIRWRAKQRRRGAERRFYGQFIRPGELCFDVGANVGNRTTVFLKLGARVVAVEPHPQCVEQLRRKFGHEPRLTIVPRALGATTGEACLFVADASTLSSMSPEWIERVKASGRFPEFKWGDSVKVPVTTLDALIAAHGRPIFCKIDVEGFEVEVLRGLSQPIQTVSFEFVPEVMERALACIERLERIGLDQFNWSFVESMRLAEVNWVSALEISRRLMALKDKSTFGDVYARITSRKSDESPRKESDDR